MRCSSDLRWHWRLRCAATRGYAWESPGWKEDLHRATAIAQNFNPLTRQAVTFYTYALAIPYGVLLPDATALRDTAETLAVAEHAGDNMTLFVARFGRAVHPASPWWTRP